MGIHVLMGLCGILVVAMTITRRKRYHISIKVWLPLVFYTAYAGFFATKVMYLLENGVWAQQSFFGAVLFFPIVLYPAALLCCTSLGDLLDFATPFGIALLAVFKLNCYFEGCCGGKALWFNEMGIPIHFPSQLIEMAVAIVLTAFLLALERKGGFEKKLYPICLVSYGITRFVLNYFRLKQSDFLFGMPAGNLWSLVSIVIGISMLLFIKKKEKRRTSSICEEQGSGGVK